MGVDKETAPLVSLLRSLGYAVTTGNPYGQTASRVTVVDALRRLTKTKHWRIRIHGPPTKKAVHYSGERCRDKIWFTCTLLEPLPREGRTPLEAALYRRHAEGKDRVTITQLIIALRGYVAQGTEGKYEDQAVIERGLKRLENEGLWSFRWEERESPTGAKTYVYFTPPEGRGEACGETPAPCVPGSNAAEGYDTVHIGPRLDLRPAG